jgi:hypothetical protein
MNVSFGRAQIRIAHKLRYAEYVGSIEETANKLLEVSARAQERARLHDEGYALITAQNAAAAAIRSRRSQSASTR